MEGDALFIQETDFADISRRVVPLVIAHGRFHLVTCAVDAACEEYAPASSPGSWE